MCVKSEEERLFCTRYGPIALCDCSTDVRRLWDSRCYEDSGHASLRAFARVADQVAVEQGVRLFGVVSAMHVFFVCFCE